MLRLFASVDMSSASQFNRGCLIAFYLRVHYSLFASNMTLPHPHTLSALVLHQAGDRLVSDRLSDGISLPETFRDQ